MPEWLTSLSGFTIGISFWPVMICILAGLCMLPLVHNERGFPATFLLLVMAITFYLMTGWNILLAAYFHPFLAILWFAGWCACGALWSMFKWNQLCGRERIEFDRKHSSFLSTSKIQLASEESSRRDSREKRSEYDTATRERMLADLNDGRIPDELIEEWSRIHRHAIPSPYHNKSRIIMWIGFWPWSLVSYVIYDFLHEVWTTIWRQLVGIYAAITQRHFSGVDPRLMKITKEER